MQVRIPISANIKTYDYIITNINYRFKFGKSLEVADFLPKNQLGSELSAPYTVGEKLNERTAKVTSLQEGAQVGFKVFDVGIGVNGSASSSDEHSSDKSSEVHFSVLPPKKTIVATGTEDEGQSVYFELHPYSQATLKGQREFIILLYADQQWIGDCFDCTCFYGCRCRGCPAAPGRSRRRGSIS